MNQATFKPFALSPDVIQHELHFGETIWDFLGRTGYDKEMLKSPLLVMLNGQEIMQANYGTILESGDVVQILQIPRGPGFVVFMYWFSIAAMVVSAVYILTMPEPSIPEAADIKEGSPTYSISARGNRYRPDSRGPVLYGTLRVVPDFDQPVFSTYDVNNDQTLHMLFRITQGKALVNISSIIFEDTPLSNFDGVSTEVLYPGQVPTLFPVGVVQSNEVSNLELLTTTAAYVANDVGTKITKIAVDLSAPSLGNQDRATGEIKYYVVNFRVEAQLINDANVPQGGWINIGNRSLSGDSRDPIRRTFEFSVEPGRYQVRIVRTTGKNDSQYVADSIFWNSLRAFLHNPEDTSHCTRLAISIRASEQIGNRTITDMSVIASRCLYSWSPDFGWDLSEQPTNSIAWALADLCRASYAGSRSDLNYNLPRLYQLDQQLTPEEHYFNAYFDSSGTTVWDALIRAGTCGRITPVDNQGYYDFIRDEQQATSVQTFTMRNIIKGSFRIDYKTPLEETADSVIMEFQDETNDYRVRELPCALPDSLSLNPRRIKMFGATNPTRVKELGMFIAATTRYRRKIISFESGIETRIPKYGSKITVSHYMIGAQGLPQISGEVIDYDGGFKIKLSEEIPSGVFSDPHIVLTDKQGKPTAAYQAVVHSPQIISISDPDIDWTQLSFDPRYKRTMFILGDGENYTTEMKVTRIEKNGYNFKVEGFSDDPRPYFYGDLVIPPDDIVIPEPQTAAPVLSNLRYYLDGTILEPIVKLSWALKNADKTLIEFSTNGGGTWVPAQTGYVSGNEFTHRPGQNDVIIYRLAAVNLFKGPWVTITVDTDEAFFGTPQDPTNLRLLEPFEKEYVWVTWDSDSWEHRIEVWSGGLLKYFTTIEGIDWKGQAEVLVPAGSGRSFQIRVYAIGISKKVSTNYTALTVTNAPPPQLDNLSVVSFLGVTQVTFTWPTSPDVIGVSVWKSATSGFTPNAQTLVIDKSKNPVLAVPVDEAVVAYIRVAAVDVWGDLGLNYSGQFTVTGKGVDLSAIYEELERLEGELTELDDTLGDVQTDLAQVESDLNAAEVDIGGLEGKFPIQTVDISNNAITAPKIMANAVEADKIVANSITTAKLVALAVTAEKIAALAITVDKLASNSVSTDKLVSNSVSTDKLAAFAVTADKIAALAITAGKIAAGAITSDKISVADLSAISASLGTIVAGLLKTTSSGSEARLEVDSSGSYPLWIGANVKSSANGQMYYDKTTQNLVIQDPNTGRRFEFQPSSTFPFWYGSGAKSAANGLMYFNNSTGRLHLRALQVESGFVTELQSNSWVNGVSGWKLFNDGSAQFNNLVISRPNVVASGTLSLPASGGGAGGAHFGNFKDPTNSLTSTFFASRYNAPVYAQDPVDNFWFLQRPQGPGFGWEGYYEFRVDIPTSTFNPDEVGVVNGRMLVAQAVVVNSEYYYSGGAPSYGYEAPCTALVTRVANYGASGSYIQIRIQVPMPFNRHPNITAIQIRSINWALSAFT